MRRIAAILLLAVWPMQALADARPDKTEIIEALANGLHREFKSGAAMGAVRPKVVVARITSTAASLTDQEVSIVIDKFESLLANDATVLDRKNADIIRDEQIFQKGGQVKSEDALPFDQSYGAQQLVVVGFRDQVGKVSADESEVTITAKLNTYDVETKRVAISKTFDVRFEHEISKASHLIRDTASFVLGTTSIASAVAGAVFWSQFESSKKKYDKAETADDATKYREESEALSKRTALSIGLAGASLLGWYVIKAMPRDIDEFHRYELRAGVFGPGAIGMEFAWTP